MAEAWGKLTGKPGICFVTRGPGACHASIGIHTARHDSTPMILFVGQVPRDQLGRGAFQEVDYPATFGDLAKWATQIDDGARIHEIVGRAYSVALGGRPGPVVIALPEGMKTWIGEDWPTGRGFSTGQMQRLALAGAFYRFLDPRIFIGIFDEPMANCDVETRTRFYRSIGKAPEFSRKTVLMSLHDPLYLQQFDRVVLLEVGQDRLFPVRKQARDHILEALGPRQRRAEVGVAHVTGLGELVGVVDRRGRHVERAPPQHELLLAELVEGLLLVLALQGAVVALVEPPRAAYGDPVPVGLVEGQERGRDRPAQQ